MPVSAKLNIIATSPDIAWLIKKVGGEQVKVESLLNGNEDPHYVDAMPHWIAKASKADIFCYVGLELEVGWAPKVIERSANKKIQTGADGHCNIGSFVTALEVPTGKIDRSMGDVHASGNPHYHLGPDSFIMAAKGVYSMLVKNDSAESSLIYKKNLAKTIEHINQIKTKALAILSQKKDMKLMSYHKEFSYFIKDFNLSYHGEVEEVPGVHPSAGRIARVGIEAKKSKIDLILATSINPKKVLEKVEEISQVKYALVPISIKKKGSPSNYEQLILGLANSIVQSK